ncbi:uncharacterized protein [Clytia hemisphaerica]
MWTRMWLGLLTILLLPCLHLVEGQEWGNCYDEGGETACYYWQMNGMCHQAGYRSYMYQICRRTCNLCPSILITPYPRPTKKIAYKPCHDIRIKCPSWKEYCQPGNEYFSFMKKHCRRSCLFCADPNCKDLNVRCPRYKASGYCHHDHRYHNYMRKNCAKACQFCVREDKDIVQNGGRKPTLKKIRRYFECDFEKDECDWWNQPFGDTGDWAVGINKNGPQQGYNGSSKYLYVNVPYRGYRAKLWLPWQLVLPEGGLKSYGEMCFHFVYQITHGRLTVHEKAQPSMAAKHPNPRTLMETLDYKHKWTKAKLTVKVEPQSSLTIIGQQGVSTSFVALDNFYFTEGRC